jgi:hypothetical protein
VSWNAPATQTLFKKLQAAGFVIDDRLRGGLREVLDRGNGKRRTGVLSPADLLQTMLDAARSRDEVAFRVAEAPHGVRTACLAMRSNYERWIVGVTTSSGATPAGCVGWGLEKWRADGDNKQLLDAWAIQFDAGKIGIGFRAPKVKRAKPSADDAAHEAALLELGHDLVRAVRLHVAQRREPVAVEVPEAVGLAPEHVDVRDLHRVDLLPQPLAGRAEVGDPGWHRDPRAGQYDRTLGRAEQLSEPLRRP